MSVCSCSPNPHNMCPTTFSYFYILFLNIAGLILRKTLCGLLKLKAYSTASLEPRKPDGGIVLAQAATVFYDTLERTYPNFPDVKSVKLSEKELVRCFLMFCFYPLIRSDELALFLTCFYNLILFNLIT